MSSAQRSQSRASRGALAVLLTLLTLVTLAGFLCLFVGVGMLRIARDRAAGEPPGGAPAAPANPSFGRTGEAAAGPGEPVRAGPATGPTEAVNIPEARARLDSRAGEPPLRAATAAPSADGAPGGGPDGAPRAARGGVGSPPPGAPVVRAAPQASASLLRVDDTSRGGWVGRYGKKGFWVATSDAAPRLPPGVGATMDGSHFYTWSPVTTDPRGLSVAEAPSRLSSGQWFSWDHFSLDLDLRGAGEGYQVALYLLDWDSDARAQQLEVTDAESGAVLLSRTDEHFRMGRYVILRLSGHVSLRFTKTGGANCTLSGVFLDDLPPADP